MDDRLLRRLDIILKEVGSQAKLAELCGLSQPYISLILKGKKDVTFDLLNSVCVKLKYNPQWVLLGVGERKIGKASKNLITEVEAFRTDVEITNARIDVMNRKLQTAEKRILELELSLKTVLKTV